MAPHIRERSGTRGTVNIPADPLWAHELTSRNNGCNVSFGSRTDIDVVTKNVRCRHQQPLVTGLEATPGR